MFLTIYMHWGCAPECSYLRGQKRALDFLKPEWQAIESCLMWVLETGLAFSARAILSLNPWLGRLSSLLSKPAFFTLTLQLEHVSFRVAQWSRVEWLFIDIYWQAQRDQLYCFNPPNTHNVCLSWFGSTSWSSTMLLLTIKEHSLNHLPYFHGI